MAINDVFKCQQVYTIDGVQCRNVVNLIATADASGEGANDDNAAEAILTITQELAQLQSKVVEHLATVTQQIYPLSKPSQVHPLSLNGAIDADSLPSSCTWIVRYYDSQYTRRKTYHWRYSGLAETATNKSRLDELFIAAHNILLNTITNSIGITTTDATWRVCSPVARIPFDPPYLTIDKANVNPVTSRLRSRQLAIA